MSPAAPGHTARSPLQIGGTSPDRRRARSSRRPRSRRRPPRGEPRRRRARSRPRALPCRRRPDARALVGGARRAAADDGRLGELSVEQTSSRRATFPFGAHVAVVEVDTETGGVELMRPSPSTTQGAIINPLSPKARCTAAWRPARPGPVRGGRSTTRTATRSRPTCSTTLPLGGGTPVLRARPDGDADAGNPLGAKGIGESGTIGATPAVQNAVVDALALGVRTSTCPARRAGLAGARRSRPAVGKPPPPHTKIVSDRGRRAAILALCSATAAMHVMGLTSTNIALPSIQHDLGLSDATLPWLVGSYSITFAGFVLLGGRMADLFGRRRMYIVGTAVFAGRGPPRRRVRRRRPARSLHVRCRESARLSPPRPPSQCSRRRSRASTSGAGLWRSGRRAQHPGPPSASSSAAS